MAALGSARSGRGFLLRCGPGRPAAGPAGVVEAGAAGLLSAPAHSDGDDHVAGQPGGGLATAQQPLSHARPAGSHPAVGEAVARHDVHAGFCELLVGSEERLALVRAGSASRRDPPPETFDQFLL